MRRGFWVAFLMLLTCVVHGQDELERSWLWQISGGELQGKSYLFGTMPLQDSTYFQFDKKVWKNLSKTDLFITFNSTQNHTSAQSVFSSSEKHYGEIPSAYLKNIAAEEQKPIIALKDDYSISSVQGNNRSSSKASRADLLLLKEHYLTANLSEFKALRERLDLSPDVTAKLANEKNYLIVGDLIEKMRLQPSFLAIDAIYLTGSEGIVQLFKDRGYKVSPINEKEYASFAEKIQQQKMMRAAWAQQNNPPNSTPGTATGTPNNGNATNTQIAAPSSPTQTVKLDLPVGILNLTEWGDYEIEAHDVSYRAPLRLKTIETNSIAAFQASYGDLVYHIDIVEKWAKTDQQIEKIIISNGGQIVAEKRFSNKFVIGKEVELMYAENQVSRHVLFEGIRNNFVLSVKGKTPEIYTLLADYFLQSFSVSQVPEQILVNIPDQPGTPNVQSPATTQWTSIQIERARMVFPLKFSEESAETEGGETVKAFISSKTIDQNTYMIVSSKKETVDNFKLFNSAINTAVEEVRGVIVERNVMPVERPNFAEYLLRDAIDNYYRIQYIYHGNQFYQIVIKGDKKSVYNDNASRILQSLIIN